MDRAVSKHCKGDFAEAEVLYEEALELASHISSEECADVLAMECQLATVLAKQHKYRAAEPVLKQALVKQGRVCDNHHPLYLSTKVKLATAYHGQGKLYQAKVAYSEALAGLIATHGSAHPSCTAIKEKLELVSEEQQTDDVRSQQAVRSTKGQWQWKPKANPFL
jgi:tetratricopeptide (TPR) repeat protein